MSHMQVKPVFNLDEPRGRGWVVWFEASGYAIWSEMQMKKKLESALRQPIVLWGPCWPVGVGWGFGGGVGGNPAVRPLFPRFHKKVMQVPKKSTENRIDNPKCHHLLFQGGLFCVIYAPGVSNAVRNTSEKFSFLGNCPRNSRLGDELSPTVHHAPVPLPPCLYTILI